MNTVAGPCSLAIISVASARPIPPPFVPVVLFSHRTSPHSDTLEKSDRCSLVWTTSGNQSQNANCESGKPLIQKAGRGGERGPASSEGRSCSRATF